MKKKIFCTFCGKTLDTDLFDEKQRQVCRHCSEIYYENPLPVVSIIVTNKNREVLLVKRGNEPFRDMWCLPIGFAETGESIEDAALRELKEETGITASIVQLIDVSSHANPLYGELIVVTFEAEKESGTEKAGDDASDCRYFPIMNLPKLAFDSQEVAIQKYLKIKEDLWNIRDSAATFVEETVRGKNEPRKGLLSDELIQIAEKNADKIIDLWLNDVLTNPSTRSYIGLDRKDLMDRAAFIVERFGLWLRGEKTEKELKEFYYELARTRRDARVVLDDLLSSLSLLKKHIWMYVYSLGVPEKAVDIYRMFEFGERLVYFFDRATHYTVIEYLDTNAEGKAFDGIK